MNKITKLTILTALLIAFLASTITPALAMDSNSTAVNMGLKAQDLAPETTRRAPSCTTEGAPSLSYYMDNDGTPADVAYSDYLEDLAHWHYWTVGECNIAPEMLQ